MLKEDTLVFVWDCHASVITTIKPQYCDLPLLRSQFKSNPLFTCIKNTLVNSLDSPLRGMLKNNDRSFCILGN